MPCVAICCPPEIDHAWNFKSPEDCAACKTPCCSPEFQAFIRKWAFSDGADHYHNDPKAISVTGLLGCLRKAYYDYTTHYAETYLALAARAWGHARHWLLEVDDGCSEIHLQRDLGDGLILHGTADRFKPDEYIKDHKPSSGLRKGYELKDAVQVNIYNWMPDDEHELTRQLWVLYQSNKGESAQKVQRLDGVGPVAADRARALRAALDAEDPALLSPDEAVGNLVKLIPDEVEFRIINRTTKPACNWCQHANRCAVENAVKEGGGNG